MLSNVLRSGISWRDLNPCRESELYLDGIVAFNHLFAVILTKPVVSKACAAAHWHDVIDIAIVTIGVKHVVVLNDFGVVNTRERNINAVNSNRVLTDVSYITMWRSVLQKQGAINGPRSRSTRAYLLTPAMSTMLITLLSWSLSGPPQNFPSVSLLFAKSTDNTIGPL